MSKDLGFSRADLYARLVAGAVDAKAASEAMLERPEPATAARIVPRSLL